MYANTSKLKYHSFVKVKVVNYKVCRALAADKKMCCEPAEEGLFIAVRDKTEYALLVAKVCCCGVVAADVAFAAGDNGCYHFIANLDGLTGCVCFDILTKSNDLACAFVSEDYGHKTERVCSPFVNVSTADACAFNFNEDIVILKFGNGEFLDLDSFCFCKHSNLSCLGDACGMLAAFAVCTVAAAAFVLMFACAVHFTNDLANNAFDVGRVKCHFYLILSIRLCGNYPPLRSGEDV